MKKAIVSIIVVKKWKRPSVSNVLVNFNWFSFSFFREKVLPLLNLAFLVVSSYSLFKYVNGRGKWILICINNSVQILDMSIYSIFYPVLCHKSSSTPPLLRPIGDLWWWPSIKVICDGGDNIVTQWPDLNLQRNWKITIV